jgi:hypothetical protein
MCTIGQRQGSNSSFRSLNDPLGHHQQQASTIKNCESKIYLIVQRISPVCYCKKQKSLFLRLLVPLDSAAHAQARVEAAIMQNYSAVSHLSTLTTLSPFKILSTTSSLNSRNSPK